MSRGFWLDVQRPVMALAPMENVTDTVFRRIVAACGRPGVFFTEFTNVDWLHTKQRHKHVHRLQFTPEERPLVAQLWGTVPENYYRAAQMLGEMGFDGIDINMGCPAGKIRHKRTCAGLIGHPAHASEIIRATQEGAGDLPVSVKTRLGLDRVQTEEWTGFLLSHQLDVLIVHGRIASEMSRKPADWDEIRKVVRLRDKAGVSTWILGNGDVGSLDEAHQKVRDYGVDGVMVGRGIFQDPHLFDASRGLAQMTIQARVALLLQHTQLFLDTWGDSKDFDIMKKFFKIYMADFENALSVRDELMQQRDIHGVQDVLHKWFGPRIEAFAIGTAQE